MTEQLSIPAEYWDRMVLSCCHNQLQQHPDVDKKALPVPARRWKSHLYVGFRARDHGIGLHRPVSRIDAHQLVPASAFKGRSTVIYRTNHTGYQVLYAKQPYVCGKAVKLTKGMPSGEPVPLADAQTFASETLDLQDEAWTVHSGHPVLQTGSFQFIVYRGLDGAVRLDMFDDERPSDFDVPDQYLLI
tara:strand:- start:3890 stop:4453 length:564 start_codon:yes stop_codon:yes gene_type:complete